jgi:rubrerythrin
MNLRAELVAVAVLGSTFAACSSNSCPHTVVDKETKVPLSSADACALAQNAQQTIGGIFTPQADCRAACKDDSITDCQLPYDYQQAVWQAQRSVDGGPVQCPAPPEGGSTVTLTCRVTHTEGTETSGCPVAGRRPEGLVKVEAPRAPDAVAAWLAQMAHLEGAAVLAFERMADELEHHGAPPDLVARARAAAADEVRHARILGDLAARSGAAVPRAIAPTEPPRPLVAMALENVAEGVVRETFGAAVALLQARTAQREDLRAAMATIADDECAHAELSWDVHAWLLTVIGHEERAAVDAARRDAIAGLERELAAEPDAVLVRAGGVPGALAARAMLQRLRDGAWAAA